jgi:hypothetical protein
MGLGAHGSVAYVQTGRWANHCPWGVSLRLMREGCGGRPQGGAQHGSEAHPGAARPRV